MVARNQLIQPRAAPHRTPFYNLVKRFNSGIPEEERMRTIRTLAYATALCIGAAGSAMAEKPFEGVELKMLGIGDTSVTRLAPIVGEFEALTGAKVQIGMLPYPGLVDKIIIESSSDSPSYQLLWVDSPWVGMLGEAGALVDLTDFAKRDAAEIKLDDIIPIQLQENTWPFVGPAGRVFDDALSLAGFDKKTLYVTNAVKHFKYELKGKRRIHQRPNASEVEHCRWWLKREIELIKPKVVVAMGATALFSLTDRRDRLGDVRGLPFVLDEGRTLFATVHPSYLLRIPDQVRLEEELARFREDIAQMGQYLP